ncbi:hypothetical protein UMZ34_10170 [Halopseudomonas pachastrellae]|nr:hypothetical protein UMZ34_10170 [Halopseudomonas pachastrellae]
MKLSRKASTTSKPAGLPSVNLPVGLAMAGIAAAAAVLWVAMSGYASSLNQALVKGYASQQVSGLNQGMAQLDRDLTRIAANPQLQVALSQGGSPTLDRLLSYHQADTLGIYTHAAGKAERIENGPAPLNFAALDMIRRAERDLPVPVEAHQLATNGCCTASSRCAPPPTPLLTAP